MSKGVTSTIDSIDVDGKHTFVVLNKDLSPRELVSLQDWLKSEGYVSDGFRVSVLIKHESQRVFTPKTRNGKVWLLLAYFVLWPVISMIVAFLLFSR